MGDSYVDLTRQGFAAAAQGDLGLITRLLATDVKWHGGDPDADGACRNRAQALAVLRGGRQRRGRPFPELVDVVGAGERVVVVMQPPSGPDGPVARTANLATFRDGKVVEMVHYPNADDALRVIGLAQPSG